MNGYSRTEISPPKKWRVKIQKSVVRMKMLRLSSAQAKMMSLLEVGLLSFLLKEKKQKFKTANKSLKLFFILLSEKELASLKQLFLFNASFHKIF